MRRSWIGAVCSVLLGALLLVACDDAPAHQDPIDQQNPMQTEIPGVSTQENEQSTHMQTAPDVTEKATEQATQPTETTEQATTTVRVDSGEPIVMPGELGYTYPELQEDLAALEQAYGAHFSYESIGKSVDGREIYACVVGNPAAPAKIMITGGIHGREYLSSLVVMKQVEHYLSAYDTGSYGGMRYAQMLEDFAFYVLPMINPDGVMLALCGIESIQTPEVRQTLESIFADNKEVGLTTAENINDYFAYNWKSNANGVDLNRNFALSNWADVKTGILSPCFRNYKGPSAASEPETKAVSAYVQSIGEIEGMLAFHTAGQVVYWDCGMTGAVRQETFDLAEAVCEHTGYKFIYDKHLDASLNDWMTLELGIPTVTVELANVIYPMPVSELDAAWEQARELWVITAQFFGQ